MKKILILNILLFNLLFASFVPFVGLAINNGEDTNAQTGYASMESPIGLFGLRYEGSLFTPYYRHLSSIPKSDDAEGINEIGINLDFKINYYTFYLGKSYHKEHEEFSPYKTIASNSNIIGIAINYKMGDIFLEYRNSQNDDMLYFGFILKFYGKYLLSD